MGYRSDLYAKVHGADLLSFLGALKQHGVEDCFQLIEEQDSEGYSRYTSTHSLKWYDTYPDVMAVNAVFESSTLSVMLRVGEEPGDTEYIGSSDLGDITFSITHSVDVEF